jgi:hypothetical protein
MSESEDENTGQDKRAEDDEADYSRQAFNHPRPYPFRDYASARTAYFKPPSSGPSDASLAGKMVVLGETQMVSHWKQKAFEWKDEADLKQRLLTAKALELARLQKSYEILEGQFNALVCRTNEGDGKPGECRSWSAWYSRLLAKGASFFHR